MKIFVFILLICGVRLTWDYVEGFERDTKWGTKLEYNETNWPGNTYSLFNSFLGPRYGNCLWYSKKNNKIVIFAGEASETKPLNDVWEFDPVSKQMIWVAGTGDYVNASDTPLEGGLTYSASNLPESGEKDCFASRTKQRYFASTGMWLWEYSADLRQFRKLFMFENKTEADMGTKDVFAVTNKPQGRRYVSIAGDDDSFYWFGGATKDGEMIKELNDLMEYKVSLNQFRLLAHGDKDYSIFSNFTADGNPPGRMGAAVWLHSGKFYMFGGRKAITNDIYSDLWIFDLTVGMWAWVKGAAGPSTLDTNVITDENDYDGFNLPSRRSTQCTFKFEDTLLFFGGYSHIPFLLNNDVWQYSISLGMWKNVEIGGNASYSGTPQIGDREGMSCVSDYNNHLYVFGARWGCGIMKCGIQGDLWAYDEFEDVTKCNAVAHDTSAVCGTKGLCVATDECVCEADYTGDYCGEWECSSVSKSLASVCSAHGDCLGPDDCDCDTNYAGDICDEWTCNSVAHDNANVCSGKGDCDAYNDCTCDTGYTGTNCGEWNCNSIDKDSALVCGGKGTCDSPDVCTCTTGYTEDFCSLWGCSDIEKDEALVCSGRGTCVAPDDCTCTTGYEGANCQTWKCTGVLKTASNVCNSHGVCSAPNVCECYIPEDTTDVEEWWGGDNCATRFTREDIEKAGAVRHSIMLIILVLGVILCL